MSNVKIVNDDFRNQVLPKGLENVDTPPSQSNSYKEYKKSINPDDFHQDEIDAQIEEYDTLNSLEDIYPCIVIDVDDFIFELVCELKKRLDQSKTGSHQSDKRDNSATLQKYENWINILNDIDGFMTPQELDVLDKCISTYASVCSCPYERSKEIKRNIYFLLNDWSEINHVDLLELDHKINHIDVLILFELTEILLELENIFYCSTMPENSHEFSKTENKLSFSAFLYHWEKSGIDSIQEYEIHTELCWINSGLIQDIWEADNVVGFYFANGSYQPEYDCYINQFNDSAQQNVDKIDTGDLECLIEEDLFNDTWLVAGLNLPNHIDYFWEAEMTNLCQTPAADFYIDFRDGLYELEDWNYPKYLCYQGDSCGFVFCNKDSCEGCTNSCTKKILNEQYVLWEKYVQPIELDDYFDAKAY